MNRYISAYCRSLDWNSRAVFDPQPVLCVPLVCFLSNPVEFVWVETAVLDSLPFLTTAELLCRVTQVGDLCVG